MLGPSRQQVHRVFNRSSFDNGGRFYGPWWQQCPKAWRREIFINDAPARRDGREGPLVREIRCKMHEEQYRAHFGRYLWNEQITGRNVVPTALNKGLGIIEVATDARAEEEFRSLWTAMIHLLQVGGMR